MDYWYFYTGESLISGLGRVLRGIVTDNEKLTEFINSAQASYSNKNIPKETYIAAFIATLAKEEFATKIAPINFSSLGQIYNLFAEQNIEQVAINFLNGRTASNYKTENLATRIDEGFISGELFFLPRDHARLYLPENINKLLGIIAFLLTKSNAERKAFNNYLRKGIPPFVYSKDYANIRPVLASFAPELRLLGEKKC